MPSVEERSPVTTVLIPAHNETATIRKVVEGALAHIDHVLVISDGSTDGTVAALEGLPVEIQDHAENLGKGLRLAQGIALAEARGARAVLTLDADGQHDPDDIPAFLAAAAASPEALVIGERTKDRAAMPFGRAASIRFGDFFISWGAGRQLRDAQCGMRLYPSSLWRRVTVPPAECRHFTFETAVLMRAGEAGIPFSRVDIRARYEGYVQRPSHYRPAIDTLRIVGVVASFLLRRGLRPRALLIALGILR